MMEALCDYLLENVIFSTTVNYSRVLCLQFGSQEALWMKKLLVAMDMMPQNEPIPIYTDSENTMTIVKKDGYNGTTKWLDLRYFFAEKYMRKDITLEKIDGNENPADGLTKPLANEKFREFVKMIELMNVRRERGLWER